MRDHKLLNLVPDIAVDSDAPVGPSHLLADPSDRQTRRPAYFLCAEFVGVDDRLSALETNKAQLFLAPFLASLRQQLESNGAAWIDVREWAVYAAFDESAQDAVGAAEEMQQVIVDLANDDRTFPVSLKIGLAVSEVWLDGATMLWSERPVALAAALCGTARAGQILTTGAFLELVSDRRLDLRVAGRFDSPLLPAPVQTVEVLWTDDEQKSHGWSAALPPQLSSRSKRTHADNHCSDRLQRAWRRCESQGVVSRRRLLGGTSEQRLDTVAALAADAHRAGAVVAYAELSPERSDPLADLARSFRFWAAGQPTDTIERVLGDELQRVTEWIPELRDRFPIHPRLVASVSDADVLGHFVVAAARSGPILWVIDGPVDEIPDLSTILAELGSQLVQAGATALILEVDRGVQSNQSSKIDAIRLRSHDAVGAPTTPNSTSVIPEHSNHWRGLDEYREQDSELYFGRESVVAELLGFVERSRAVALVGDRWSGKSSLLAAGVIPALRSGALRGSEHWALVAFRPGSDPLRSLQDAIDRHPGIDGDDPSTTLLAAARDHGRLLVVIDQFEELFERSGPTECAAFFDLLSALVGEPEGRVRVLVAVHTESYGACAEHRFLGPSFERNLLMLRSPRSQDLEDIVRKPAHVAGFEIEDDVVSQLVTAAADRSDPLPLISHVLRTLERHRGSEPISAQLYESLGGLDGSVEHSAELLYAQAENQAALREAFLMFLGEDAHGALDFVSRTSASLTTEQRVALQPFVDVGLVRETDEQLCLARGLVAAHWPRAAEWFDTERQRIGVDREIEEASRRWERERRHPSLLLSGFDLRQATRPWLDGDLSPTARSLLQASWDAETDQQERHLLRIVKLERRQSYVCAVALVAMLVTFVVLLLS